MKKHGIHERYVWLGKELGHLKVRRANQYIKVKSIMSRAING